MAFDVDKMTAALMAAVGENSKGSEPTSWLDTGYLPLNKMISGDPTRGFAGGRMYEIAGPSASGKTLLATQAMIAAQIHWRSAFKFVIARPQRGRGALSAKREEVPLGCNLGKAVAVRTGRR